MSHNKGGRRTGIPEPELIARISAWRAAYTGDPRVTSRDIAAAVGVSQSTVELRIKQLDWVVPADVKRARKGHKHDGFPELPHPTGPVNDAGKEADPGPSRAAPSIWHLAAGKTVTTARWGGKHIETRPLTRRADGNTCVSIPGIDYLRPK